ncbi:adenylosuccinate lyase family protein [Ramlibacter sp. WS9]|uniref:class-II fumarase/aspartase family protein n=1 Tax=Ramlibacter sp. WS9 TaxID=1882741 RepID=UPI001143A2BF|nr:adenylosuccinate lyase family protein [Ramlibacter sp. WS9]ROZ79792.1 adenylosuccinate lyase family protein [Ramlibacter sp. WS9]
MFNSFVTRYWFSSEARSLWSDSSTLQAWLDVEAALASAQAEIGLIPADAAATIASKADAKFFDTEALAHEIAFAQHPLVPVLHRFESLCGEPHAGYLHFGATTQNIFDTATALQVRRTHALLASDLRGAMEALAQLARAHRETPMAGRTHGQHALPMTLGFKIAGWLEELGRDLERLDARLAPSFPACMGGAIGTFAAMGGQGREVEALVASKLGLEPAGLPSRASFDRAADYIGALALLAGTAQKIAGDVVFLQRTEVGELSEAFHVGKVGSSTMAQKRNPSTALLLVSLARMLRGRVPLALEAMVRMDEGDSSATNVTDTLLPELGILAASVAQTLSRLVRGLVVHPEAMRRNLAATQGLINAEAVMMELTKVMGRHEAHKLLLEAAQRTHTEGCSFLASIMEHPSAAAYPSANRLAEALDPGTYIGDSVRLTDEAVSRISPRAR